MSIEAADALMGIFGLKRVEEDNVGNVGNAGKHTREPSRTQVKKPKQKKCRVCGELFTQTRAIQPVCQNFDCMVAFADKKASISRKRRERVERIEAKARRERIKTRREYIKEAQIAFNAFIRERDKDKPCICCGKPLASDSVGGGFDCGHYRSVGSAPHLRFNEDNAHGQTKQCNRWGAGRAVDYRIGLVNRIGLERVEALEADQEPRKYSIEELKEIIATYKQKLKALKSNQQGL